MAPAPKTTTVANDELEHTEGGVTTRDAMDAGVPMTPGDPREPIGPEDAFGPGVKRGDYSDRTVSGPSMETRIIPESERTPDGPIYELVPQGSRASEVGDVPGKGGVSTEAALEETAAAQSTEPGIPTPSAPAEDAPAE
jgi:hypothetical protein